MHKNALFLLKNCKNQVQTHGHRQRGRPCHPLPSWIFIDDTDKVEGGLTMLFFRSCFFRCLSHPGNFSADALGIGGQWNIGNWPIIVENF